MNKDKKQTKNQTIISRRSGNKKGQKISASGGTGRHKIGTKQAKQCPK
jgi:hypothetical protein